MISSFDINEWEFHKNNRNNNVKNRETVTARIKKINKSVSCRIAIGVVICELLDLKRGQKVSLLVHKKNKNLMLITAAEKGMTGYTLSGSTTASARTFDFIFKEDDQFKMEITHTLPYEITDKKTLIINFESVKWNK